MPDDVQEFFSLSDRIAKTYAGFNSSGGWWLVHLLLGLPGLTQLGVAASRFASSYPARAVLDYVPSLCKAPSAHLACQP